MAFRFSVGRHNSRMESAKMKQGIQDLLLRVRSAEQEADAYAFLPEIGDILEQMLEDFRAPEETRVRLARGLIRIVTDKYSFSESSLGGDLLKAAEEYA